MIDSLQLIRLIAVRAVKEYMKRGIDIRTSQIKGEISIVHYDICPLNLQEMLNAPEDLFMYDVAGIHQNLDILDGSFRKGFYPFHAKNYRRH
jgi:hypothetical protein